MAAGSVMHAAHGVIDMRRLGGLKAKMPTTYWTFVVGGLALAGFPLTAGFFSKDEILQMYFNEIPYGSTSYGVEAASQRYFGKGAKGLTLAESAILAALPQAPSRYSPYGSNKELLMERQRYIDRKSVV